MPIINNPFDPVRDRVPYERYECYKALVAQFDFLRHDLEMTVNALFRDVSINDLNRSVTEAAVLDVALITPAKKLEQKIIKLPGFDDPEDLKVKVLFWGCLPAFISEVMAERGGSFLSTAKPVLKKMLTEIKQNPRESVLPLNGIFTVSNDALKRAELKIEEKHNDSYAFERVFYRTTKRQIYMEVMEELKTSVTALKPLILQSGIPEVLVPALLLVHGFEEESNAQ